MQSFKDDGDEYNWEMTIEGTAQEFLGINIDRIENTHVGIDSNGTDSSCPQGSWKSG
jgi:hypothetical protein